MKSIIKFLAGVIVGVALTLLLIVWVLPQKIFTESESKLNFEETVEAVVESAEAKGWTISHIYDLQASLLKKGFEVNPVYVLSLCSPEYAKNVLGTDDDRHVSAMMPCRVSVYQKGGKTYISMLNAELFSPFLSKNAKRTIVGAANETTAILKPVID
ncbi:Uncharacterized conserved protein, DUF302 family [Mariniphaga anaerophila]|uniref:Uncharacterized conserved protein, DUF302 family n=1 Tax=Mariniphaga anaerophila TaxID=1484053 RepID=A0A1M5AF19_9BACT|nr:DUF302 domain-containing protein [Mariniphaga anaerophila]SHF28839.1 Uncharacterized conserved protein, DUF302 family [Mariniphaga anaerophila]